MKMTKPQIISAEEPVSKALAMIRKSGEGVLVYNGKKYAGMLDERAVGSHSADPSKMKAGKLVVKTPVLSPGSPLLEVCQAFFSGRFKTLPVMEGSRCVGMVGRYDVLQELSTEGFLTGHKVSQYMSSPILTIDAAAPVSSAHSTLRGANVRRLAVVSNGRLVGVVSVFDLLPARNKPRGRQPEMRSYPRDENAPVSSYMHSEVHTIAPTASLAEAVEQMLDKGMVGLIVSDQQRPVGILTFKDILQAVMRSQASGKGAPVFVSGLHNLDKDVAGDLVAEGERLLDKLGGSVGAQAMSLHVKQDGKEYRVSAHIQGDHMLRATASGWTLMEAMRKVMGELKNQTVQAKKTGMGRRDNF
ncbi:MAG: CBS domain-containing protein [Candidatus Micrarchaeota archaeon]|nr:CBS domain-containing protein [Candidatus Micrarchaeota archaeon]